MLFLPVAVGLSHAGQFGPATPAARPGQVSQEVGYFHSRADWTTDDEDKGFGDRKLSQNQIYLQAGYGLAPGWEAYFRLGGADLRMGKTVSVLNESDEPSDSFAPFATLGARGLLYDGQAFDLGLFAQGSYFFPYEDRVGGEIGESPDPVLPAEEKLKLQHLWDVDAGLTLQGSFRQVTLYAGPFLYYGQGKMRSKVEALGLSDSSTSTYEPDGYLGGMAGIRIPLFRHIYLILEGQTRSGEFSAGGAVSYLRPDR
jgi:hypothetical protein